MKLTVRKHNKTYEKELEDVRANPAKYTEADSDSDSDDDDSDSSDSDSSSDDDSDSSDDDDDDDKSSSSNDNRSSDDGYSSEDSDVKFAKTSVNDDDDDSLFGSGTDSDDSDDDDDDDNDGRPELAGRAKWLKKVVVSSKKGKKTPKVPKVPNQSAAANKPKTVKRDKAFKIDDNMTEATLDIRMNEIIAMRGRKGTEAKTIVYQLQVLSKVSRHFGAKKEIPILMHLISAMFDSNRLIDEFMDLATWRNCRNCMMRIVDLLDENPNLTLGMISADDMTDIIMAGQKQDDFIKMKDDDEESEKVDQNLLKLVGSMDNYLVRLEDEYTKSLQQINPHTQDYVIRLSDEAFLLELAEGLQKYFERIRNFSVAAEVALLRMEHQYYKHNSMALQVKQAHNFTTKWGSYTNLHPGCTGRIDGNEGVDTTSVHPACFQGNPSVPVPTVDPDKELELLCAFIFKHGDDRHKTRALLCAVYHHAMHDRYYRARDLFLISHIQDNIDKTDTKTQILYNRTLVTLGLAAFRAGLIQKAYECLSGVCTGRVRELLAQGQARSFDKDPEQEKAERRRQIPYHMHINPDLLDCCYLTCAMLIELPQMVSGQGHANQRSRSHYRKYLQSYNRQVFTGPPENTREHILAASKALVTGDWKKAHQFILNLDVWNLIPNDGGQKVKTLLQLKMKDEALRIYLFQCASNYESITLAHLCSLFNMDRAGARRIISKMIFRNELSGAWDQCLAEETLVLNKVDASSLQQVAQQMADKVAYVMENNERMLDPLTSSYGYKDEWNGRDNRKQYGGGDGQKRSYHKNGPHWKPQNGNANRQQGGGRGGGRGGRGGRGNRRDGNNNNRGGYRTDDSKNKSKPMGWGNTM